MATAALEVMGFFLGLSGMIGTLVATVLPYWEISSHIGPSIVTAVDNMKGLWMECVFQSTGAFQCETYNTILGLNPDLQAARALMVISAIFSVLACAVSTVGMQCTVCLDGSAAKGRVAGFGGGLFLTAGLLSLIPVSWRTHEVVQTFYQPFVPDSMKFEIGACLYVGLAASLMSMLGGGLLCVSCCDELDGIRGRGGRHSGGYPYHERMGMASMSRAGAVPYRAGTVSGAAYANANANTNVTAKNQTLTSQTSTSNHSSIPAQGSRRSAHPNTDYDVTGYV
ncbi:claudin-2 [Chanos chanos]|uniref:Claudin-14-like n=1 Tax=Chanos chanos TaxID=29144 RepID=A0A6J2WXP6_CHACN|nr:claudin-14-like [Chanos chanos]XP_030649063.1 claudin-14-like [Chanos chanos]